MTGIEFFLADVILVNFKTVQGASTEVFAAAGKFGGFYFRTKEESIFYLGDNLHVKMMFERRSECAKFVNDLDCRLSGRFLPQNQVRITRPFQQIPDVVDPVCVLLMDGVSFAEDQELKCTDASARGTIDLETEMCMIESKEHHDFLGLRCYKCHLVSPSDYPEERDNPNNFLWLSGPSRLRFDGLHTTGDLRVPLFAVSYVSRSHEIQVFGASERERVTVAIECVDDRTLNIMRGRVKAGSRVDDTARKITVSVFVLDAEDFQRCLTHKYRETQLAWATYAPGAPLTEEEARALRQGFRQAAAVPGTAKAVI